MQLTPEFMFLFWGVSVLMHLICSGGSTLIKFPLIVEYIVTGAVVVPVFAKFPCLNRAKQR